MGFTFTPLSGSVKNEMTSVFMISKWPTQMSTSEMASTVKEIIEGTFATIKAKGESKIEKDAKLQYCGNFRRICLRKCSLL